jgi:hypothetical protein
VFLLFTSSFLENQPPFSNPIRLCEAPLSGVLWPRTSVLVSVALQSLSCFLIFLSFILIFIFLFRGFTVTFPYYNVPPPFFPHLKWCDSFTVVFSHLQRACRMSPSPCPLVLSMLPVLVPSLLSARLLCGHSFSLSLHE